MSRIIFTSSRPYLVLIGDEAMRAKRSLVLALQCLFVLVSSCFAVPSDATVTLDDFWAGRAHFEQIGELKFGDSARGGAAESSSWFAAKDGVWYVFNRVTVRPSLPACAHDHTRVVVRESRDKGKSWSPAEIAVEPGASPKGDGCAILDGSTIYDPASNSWHMLAQCLDRNNAGGWALCHYIRKYTSAEGLFTADPRNPVVRGGQLWSRICAGGAKSCPSTTLDEGTPDILEKRGGLFYITFHGFDPHTKQGYRAIAATPDFHEWTVSGAGLPGDAIMGPNECHTWLAGCAGVGEASTVTSGSHRYTIAESMNGGLLCTRNQEWVFALFRTPLSDWPRSGSGKWTTFRDGPLLRRTYPDRETSCALAYARWLSDGHDLYLIYEDWEPGHAYLHRRLLKLAPGSGPPVRLR